LVAPDAVDEKRFADTVDGGRARKELHISPSERVVTYTGHLYAWKGIDTVVAAAAELSDVVFLIVGGMPDDQNRLRSEIVSRGLSNVRLEGHVSPARVPLYLAASDVLLLPNSAATPLSSRHTSPMKAFEYMAAGRPIVASDLPSLRELFASDVDALLVAPDDPGELARAVRRLLDDPSLSERLAASARRKVRDFTWSGRAAAILEFARRRGGFASAHPVSAAHKGA
jgi:glycosyltransferase involved in cell wall biosynthesis